MILGLNDGLSTKVILEVKSLGKLMNLSQKLYINNIKHCIIEDNCLTELTPETEFGTTVTCIGITPYLKSDLEPYLGNLRLLK
jgi:peptidyl-tRNA hydrolase